MPYVTTNGIEMYYEEHGEGEPLLLIMGITARGGVWEKHLQYWKKSFRCIIADNRGVGLSGAPPGPYSAAQMAADYAGLLDALSIKKLRVVGCSMGSIIAQQLALLHPEKVASMVLMCPWARCDERAKAIFQHIVDCKKCLPPEAFALYIQLLIFSKKYWDSSAGFKELKESRRNVPAGADVQTPEGLAAQAAACTSHHVLAQLSTLTQPTLVIGGSEDAFTPPWMAEEIAAEMPAAELHLYEGRGHAFHWEALDDFNPRVQQWLLSH